MSEPQRAPSAQLPELPKRRNRAKIEKMYRKKARRLEKELQMEIGKNVDLYNRKNKAAAVLKRLTQENNDLLDVLAATLDTPELPPAEKAALSPEQEEFFHLTRI